MPMKNPPHPGSVVLSECIEPLGITITQAAQALGVTRTTLSELVNGRRGISPEMAIRLSQVFGGSAQSWITQQAHYDSWRRFPQATFGSSGWPWLNYWRLRTNLFSN
jgi:addiction module HigA family antidote